MWRKTKKILKGLNLYKVVNYNYISFNCIDNIINIRYDSYANKCQQMWRHELRSCKSTQNFKDIKRQSNLSNLKQQYSILFDGIFYSYKDVNYPLHYQPLHYLLQLSHYIIYFMSPFAHLQFNSVQFSHSVMSDSL